jgi:hypothetical protein
MFIAITAICDCIAAADGVNDGRLRDDLVELFLV